MPNTHLLAPCQKPTKMPPWYLFNLTFWPHAKIDKTINVIYVFHNQSDCKISNGFCQTGVNSLRFVGIQAIHVIPLLTWKSKSVVVITDKD